MKCKSAKCSSFLVPEELFFGAAGLPVLSDGPPAGAPAHLAVDQLEVQLCVVYCTSSVV